MKTFVSLALLILSVLPATAQGNKRKVFKAQFTGRYKTDTLTDTGRYFKDANQYVTLVDIQGSYILANFRHENLYIKADQLVYSNAVKSWFDSKMLRLQSELQKTEMKLYRSKYGTQYATDVLNSKIRLGQPESIVIAILGEPTEKHREVSQGVVKVHWIYSNTDNTKAAYCDFNNGKLVKFGD